MSTDAERAAAKKVEADKKAAEDAAAATTAAAFAWPTGGYNAFIPLLFIFGNSVNAMLVIYLWIKLVETLPVYSATHVDLA